MRIGLDFDGVITNCGKFKSDMGRELFGLKIPPDEFKKKILLERDIFTEETYLAFGKRIYGTWKCGQKMEPVEGALEYIPLFLTAGHEVFIVTSRDHEQLEVARRWLKIRGIKIDFYGVGYGKSKLEIAVSMKADIIVDDDLKKLSQLVGYVKHLFLFSWGYNLCEDVGAVIQRIPPNWREFYRTIQTL